jgi:cytochrome c556
MSARHAPPRLLTLGSLALLLLGACEHSHKHETPAEETIEYRHSIYHVISWNVHEMGRMVEKKSPYDHERFAVAAQRVAFLAPILPEAFPADSYVPGKTAAKPEIWKNPDDFQGRLKKFAADSAAFAELAKTADLDRLTPAFKELTGECKSCHEKYRKDD